MQANALLSQACLLDTVVHVISAGKDIALVRPMYVCTLMYQGAHDMFVAGLTCILDLPR